MNWELNENIQWKFTRSGLFHGMSKWTEFMGKDKAAFGVVVGVVLEVFSLLIP
jgi:hypothetical protein